MSEGRAAPNEIVVSWMNNTCAKLSVEAILIALLIAFAELVYAIKGSSATVRIIVLVASILATVVSWEVLSQRTVVRRDGRLVCLYTEIFSLRIPGDRLDATKGLILAKQGPACLGYQAVCISYEVDIIPRKPISISVCRTTLPHARILKSAITDMATRARQDSVVT